MRRGTCPHLLVLRQVERRVHGHHTQEPALQAEHEDGGAEEAAADRHDRVTAVVEDLPEGRRGARAPRLLRRDAATSTKLEKRHECRIASVNHTKLAEAHF